MSRYAYAIATLFEDAYYTIWDRKNDANSKNAPTPPWTGSSGIERYPAAQHNFVHDLCVAHVSTAFLHTFVTSGLIRMRT